MFNSRSKEQTIKVLLYIAILFFTAVLQSIPNLFGLGLAKPNMVLAVAVTIAMFEHELTGGLLGAFAGLLWDSMSSLLFGMAGIIYLVFCTIAALLCIYLLQRSLKNCMCLAGGFTLIFALLCYFFSYGMWGFDGASLMIWQQVIPSAVITTLLSPAAYYLIRKVHSKFEVEGE